MPTAGRDYINLPFPPSVNRLWRAVKGRNIKSAEYRDWQTTAGQWLMTQKPGAFYGPVSVSLTILPPDKRRRDIDNLAKAVMDLLVKHGVIERDDWLIVRELHISIGEQRTAGDGLVQVTIEPLEATE